MKKALVTGPRQLVMEELPERHPGPGEVLADMLLTTLTTANLRIYHGNLLADLRFPATLSYTGVARVREVGEGVTDLVPGDLVYPNFYRACLECRACRADRLVACEKQPPGAHNMMVGAQYESALQHQILFPRRRFYKAPEGANPRALALAGFVSVSMQAVDAVGLADWAKGNPDGDPLLVVGAGPIGWGALALAKLTNTPVVMTEVRPSRIERAKAFGADHVIDATAPDAREQVLAALGGKQALRVVECSGSREGAAFAADLVARGGQLALVGVCDHPWVQAQVVMRGLHLHGIGGAIRVQECVDLIGSGKIDLSDAISHTYPFSRLEEALRFKEATPEAELVGVDLQA